MTLTAELRALARTYRLRAMAAERPVDRSMLLKMSEELDRDARIAEQADLRANRWQAPMVEPEADAPQSKAA